MNVYELDGTKFATLEEFFAEFSREVTPDWYYPHPNLDGFNDVLRGGFGSPDEGFTLRWKHHQLSKERLVRQLEPRLIHCHPSNRAEVSRKPRKGK